MSLAKERIKTGEILKTPAGEIEYSVEGEGTPMLLLHGAGGGFDQGLWMKKVFLEDKYKFISVSRYGFLRSPIPDNASIKNQAALYSALLDDLNVTKVIVVAGSAGGASAIQFANDYPEKTLALILLFAVSGPEPEGSEEPISTKIIHLIQQSDYTYWIFSEFMESSILNLMGVPEDVFESFDPEQKRLAKEMLDVMHPMTRRYKGTINDAKMLYLENISTENITSPTLILHSKDDALVNYAHAINSHDKIKQSKLILFETGGHAMLSQLDEVRRNIKEFLNMSGNEILDSE
ncbi:MAG: alpha/beta hydrolase [Candidatus Methanoperedens sp.]|nr:alpha/beta hydrolase [Candidatus Methanoperedens sp.]